MVPETTIRVPQHTAEHVNQRIRAQTETNIASYAAAGPEAIDQRLKELDPDTMLLEYALGEDRSYVWAVTPDSIRCFQLPARVEIEAAARRVRPSGAATNAM